MTMIEVTPRLRHPEKAHRPDNPIRPKPSWLRVKAPVSKEYQHVKQLIRGLNLTTVCEEAGCPNIAECWKHKHATFMLMGDICTRGCAFCNVATGKPYQLDPMEPMNVATAVARMALLHVVVTSVDRDDLVDGGAAHFVRTIEAIRHTSPHSTIEILTPDFMKQKDDVIATVVMARPDVFNHNLETVPRLYPTIRPGARYFTSLRLLSKVKELDPTRFTKSGIMVGLGETNEEVYQIMDDLRAAEVDFLTIGQYLQPSRKHVAIDRFVTPSEFETYALRARAKGFLMVSSSPLTRSSYHAGDDFKQLQAARKAATSFLTSPR